LNAVYSPSFKRSFKKYLQKHPQKRDRIKQRIDEFLEDPYAPHLKTHKLSGILKGLSAFSVENDLRVIFKFESEDLVVMMDVGAHKDVY